MINGDPILTKAYVYGQPFKPLPAERCIPLAGNQLLTMGDSEWLFIHTPGHSKGSSCLLGAIGDQRWLIAGDTVGGSLIDPDLIGPEASAEYLAEWRASLTMLSQLEFDWVLTGHDHRPLSRAEFDHRVRYFGRMTNPWFDLDEDDEEAAASVAYLSTLLTLGHHTHAAD